MSHPEHGFATIGIAGCGALGASLARTFAASGRQVIVVEANEDRLAAGRARVSALLGQGQHAEVDREATEARITGTTTMSGLADADLAIEAVTEDRQAKKAVLGRIAESVPAGTPIATTTSTLSVTELAGPLPNSARVAGLHFFGPALEARTVEVIRAEQTGDDLADRLLALMGTLGGLTAVLVRDRPGFLLNALVMPYFNDVIAAYDASLATAGDIDTALRLGLGYLFGPLETLDAIGLDIHLQATESAYEATRDLRYAPPPLLRRMVAAGRLGAKSGSGFRLPRQYHDLQPLTRDPAR